MTIELFLEQVFNGLQAGVTLFLTAAGLTLILGVMNFVFLAHGSLVMIGAYAAATLAMLTGSFYLGVLFAIPFVFLCGYVLEYVLIRHLYHRDHMEQVLVTFGLILFFNEAIRVIFGPATIFSNLPPSLSGFIHILPEVPYPVFRLVIIMVGLVAAAMLYYLVMRTRLGALVRAGTDDAALTEALGIHIGFLRRVIFAIGASLAGIAGMMLGPLSAVEPGMGEPLLIQSLVVIIIGGIGSIRGSLIAAMMIGLIDTTGRVFLPLILRGVMDQASADGAGPALASMMIYIFMSVVLVFKPSGLFPRGDKGIAVS